MFWVFKNAIVWANVWEFGLSWWRVTRLRRLAFPISWKMTGKQMFVYQWSELTVLRGTNAKCPVSPQSKKKNNNKKTRRSFACICFVCEQLLLDLAHLKTPIQSTAVFCFGLIRINPRFITMSRCHRCVSKNRDHIFGAFLSTNRHETFFERLINCVGSNANTFLWQWNVHAILNECWFH